LPTKPRGVPRSDDRKVLNGIYWRLRKGSSGPKFLSGYGPSATCYNRFVRWAKIGVWDLILEPISEACGDDLQMIDGSSLGHALADDAERTAHRDGTAW
jgi:transposase